MGNTLEGKVALVNGAGRGLGKSHALSLSANGAKVVVADLGVSADGTGTDEGPANEVIEEIKEKGGEAVAVFGDVGNYSDAGKAIQTAVDTYGDLNIVVCNAGFCRDKMIFSMTEDEFDSVIRVHLKGHFNYISHACKYWRKRAKDGKEIYGRLITTTSEAFLFASIGQPNYAAAKAGIVQLTLIAAQAMAKYGITANTIAPRARTTMTEAAPMTAAMFAKPECGFDVFSPDNVSPLVSYLASPMAQNISGQMFIVHGSQVRRMEAPVAGELFVNDAEEAWTMEKLDEKMTPFFAGKTPVHDGFIVTAV